MIRSGFQYRDFDWGDAHDAVTFSAPAAKPSLLSSKTEEDFQMNISKTNFSIASAAVLFAATMAGAADLPAGASGKAVGANDTVHCYGVNSCKGTADCANANHECKGNNECKGQGFKAMAAKACLAKGGVIADLK